ncbi:MAG: DEAD/DEAH box helicase [Erysipelotrichaceae bacterium]|jgi:superfamily II DNA or RNA helicase|nr:DEAD/DEAH box helicase [Erysipelotrichaceae bacterium]
MPDKLQRPDRQTAKQNLKNITSLVNALQSVLKSEKVLCTRTLGVSESLRKLCALQELKDMDIELLNANKEGIRLSALRHYGIQSIYQLYGRPIRVIMDIEGIGEQSAIKIKHIVDEIYHAVYATARIQFDIQKTRTLNPDFYLLQADLLKDLYVLLKGGEVRDSIRKLLESEPDLKTTLKAVKPATNTLHWLFSSRAKKEMALEAFDQLTWLADGCFGIEGSSLVEQYQSLIQDSSSRYEADFVENSVSYYTLLEQLGANTPQPATAGLPSQLVAQIDAYPLDLSYMKSELRHYQVFGAKYVLNQRRALLGDEMGLGKTVVALAVMADLKARGQTHFLVVCPASVLVNWQRETHKHADLSALIIHGNNKEAELSIWKEHGGVGITNYETIVGLGALLDFDFGLLVVDEAHFVKNPQARRTKALLAVAQRCERILYMTGTPLENRVDEMCFLVRCLDPEIAMQLTKMKTLQATLQFRKTLAPVYLRRTRSDVLSELPDLIENEDWLEISFLEQRAYAQSVAAGNFMAMRRVSWDVDAGESSKASRLLELCEAAKEDGLKILVFSFFLDTLNKVCGLLKSRACGPLTGAVSNPRRQQIIDEFTQSGTGQVLVAQVQTGGTGLNIQSASVVIFCEPQIKPSLESQAIARAYRMGQVRDVQVHRLLAADTIDERMMELLSNKQLEFDTYADESVIGVESLRDTIDSAWIKEAIEAERKRLREVYPDLIGASDKPE